MCTPELVSCLLDVLSDTSDENYELWAEARNILQLFGHKLTGQNDFKRRIWKDEFLKFLDYVSSNILIMV